MNEYGALWKMIHGEMPKQLKKKLSNTDIVHIPHGLSLDLTVVYAEVTQLNYSVAHDKNFYFDKPQLLLFRITSKCCSARILPHLPSTEDLRNPFCIQSPQIVNFVGINLTFIGQSNENVHQQRLISLQFPQISLYYTAKYVSV